MVFKNQDRLTSRKWQQLSLVLKQIKIYGLIRKIIAVLINETHAFWIHYNQIKVSWKD